MLHVIERNTDRRPEEVRMMIVLGLLRDALKHHLMWLNRNAFHLVAVTEVLKGLDLIRSAHKLESVTSFFTRDEATGRFGEVDAILERLATPKGDVQMLVLSPMCINFTEHTNGLVQSMLAKDLEVEAHENRPLRASCEVAMRKYIDYMDRSR